MRSCRATEDLAPEPESGHYEISTVVALAPDLPVVLNSVKMFREPGQLYSVRNQPPLKVKAQALNLQEYEKAIKKYQAKAERTARVRHFR